VRTYHSAYRIWADNRPGTGSTGLFSCKVSDIVSCVTTSPSLTLQYNTSANKQ
jgi:hypothetical protein